MKMNKKRIITILLWIIAIALLGGIILLVSSKPETPPTEEIAEKATPVVVLPVTPRVMPDMIVLPGKVTANRDAIVAAEQDGRITALPVEKGDTVSKGDLLLEIDNRIPKATLRRAQAAFDKAKRDLKRIQELRGAGAVSQSDLDNAQTQYDNAEAALDAAETQLNQCSIHAPFLGQINNRFVELGEYATVGGAAFQLVQTNPLKVIFSVPEQDILAVHHGMTIPFRIPNMQDRKFEGTVSVVSAAASANNTFDIEMISTNPDGNLRPGMLADVELTRNTWSNAVVVPLAAIVPKSGKHVVFIEHDSRAQRRTVEISALYGHEAVLADGINIGDRVIVQGHRALIDGTLLNVDGEWTYELYRQKSMGQSAE